MPYKDGMTKINLSVNLLLKMAAFWYIPPFSVVEVD
jgi:hypothetical protein